MTARIAPPPIWPASAYVRPVGAAPDGRRSFTHLAVVHPPDQAQCRAYVKHFPQNLTKGLFNEWFGHALLRVLGVPQPPAGLLQAPTFDGTEFAWAFASCQPMPKFEGTPKQLYDVFDPVQHRELTKRLWSCTHLPLLIAADQLLANSDRNIGNLVFTGKSAFVAIDQGEILGGGSWTRGDLAYTQQWVASKILQLQPIHAVTPGQRSSVQACAEVVTEAFFAAQVELRNILGQSGSPEVEQALDAVWWRCLPIAEWFRERLELLA